MLLGLGVVVAEQVQDPVHGQQLDLRFGAVAGGLALPGGDVALCPTVAAAQGAKAGHGTWAELELLTVHGILHLLGYDHAEPAEKAEMWDVQGRLLEAWRAPGNRLESV